MKVILYLCALLLIHSCISVGSDKSKEKKYSLKYGIRFFDKEDNGEVTINVLYTSNLDAVKSGVFSQVLLKDYNNISKAVFYFEMPNRKLGTLIYNKQEIDSLKQLYNQNPCLLKSSEHILLNLSNDKILFYDSTLYDIMIYDSQLNKIDMAYYAKSDISIVSILLNQCLYDKENIPNQFQTQWKYFQALHIWCENKKSFPLYDERDFGDI